MVNVNPEADKIVAVQKSEKEKAALNEKAEKEITTQKEKLQKNIQVIIDATTLTQVEAESVFTILNDVGFKTITECSSGLGTNVDNLKSFRATCDGIVVTLTIQKRKVYYIGVGSIDLYDSKKGGKLNDVNDYVLSSTEELEFIIKAEDFVTQGLKAPSTAKFPGKVIERDKWSASRYKNTIQVTSYVDSQNSFGAMIRSNFVVEFNYVEKNPTYLSIDGKTIYGTPYKK